MPVLVSVRCVNYSLSDRHRFSVFNLTTLRSCTDESSKDESRLSITFIHTICRFFYGVCIPQEPGPNIINSGMIGMLSRKNLTLRSSICWKCNEIVNPTITTLFCIILYILRSHQADLLGSWGKGGGGDVRACACTSRTLPPAYGPDMFPA